MSKLVTTENFILNARKIHGDFYDYNKVNYITAIKNVTITCPKHGDFVQRPANHLSGKGCRKCAGNSPLTFEEFKERAQKVHGNRYDYSNVLIKNVDKKISIICKDHGVFHQVLKIHLKGFNCPKCGRVSAKNYLGHNIIRFAEDARKYHGDKYDYSKVKYVNALSNVIIICPKHGEFSQIPASHKRGVGCPKCGDESTASKRVRTTKDYIDEAKTVHASKYDYSKCIYKTMNDKLEVICPDHGSFWVLASNHVKGNQSGCPDCAESGFKPNFPGVLYYIAIISDTGEILYKIGITNLSVEKRFPVLDRKRMRIVKLWRFECGAEAAKLERDILTEFKEFKYKGVNVLIGAGNAELFKKDVLNLDDGTDINLHDDLPIFSRRQKDFNFIKTK
jgi:Zn finger protein HypA/HybF involved in hydrogenase expression